VIIRLPGSVQSEPYKHSSSIYSFKWLGTVEEYVTLPVAYPPHIESLFIYPLGGDVKDVKLALIVCAPVLLSS
jgi:hypothetical protein